MTIRRPKPRIVAERGRPAKTAMYEATADALAEATRAKEWFDVEDSDFAASQAIVWLDSVVYEAGRG